MATAAARRTEQAEAIERLRDWIKPGDTLYTVLRHRAASGMSRSIDVYGFGPAEVHGASNPNGAKNLRISKSWYSHNIAKAGIGVWDDKRKAVRVSGGGMDMGFHIVYTLGRVLFPDGFGCVGEGCPANDHTNGDRDYTPHGDGNMTPDHWHRGGGYALRQEWIG